MARKKKSKEQCIEFDALKACVYINYHYEWENKFTACAGLDLDNKVYAPEIHFNATEAIAVPVIVHELIHALTYEFTQRKGFCYIGNGEDEVLPYCIEYALEEVIKFCKKNRIEVKL